MNNAPAKYRTCFIGAVLTIAVIAVFGQVHTFDFINYDDDVYVSQNSNISPGFSWKNAIWVFSKEHGGNWHPLTGLSHILDCQLFGLNPGRHHLVNLLFHIANTLLLLAVLAKMTGAFWKSAFVAALFALHPLHVESVAWISERKDVLSSLFWILTMAAYYRYTPKPAVGRFLLTLTFFALGLMAKPMLVTLPFVLLLLDYWPLNRLETQTGAFAWPALGHCVREKIPFFALAAVSSVITFIFQKNSGAMLDIEIFPLTTRLANAAVSYIQYIGKMFWPARLAVFYPYHQENLTTGRVIIAVAVLLLITIYIFRLAPRHKYLATGWFWYLGTLVPVIGLVPVGLQAMADRYTYLPAIGIFVMLAWGADELLSKLRYRKVVLSAAGSAALAGLMIITSRQVGYWKDSFALFEHALAVTQKNFVIHNNLGCFYGSLGRWQEAMKACKQAIRIDPDYAKAQYNLGVAYSKLSRWPEAIEAFKQAVRIQPDSAEVHFGLGLAYSNLDRWQEAIAAFKQAVRLQPDLAKAHYNLGVIYVMMSDKAAALAEYNILKTLDAEKAEKLFNLFSKQ